MKNYSKRLFGAIAASVVLASNSAFAIDPCQETSSMSGGQRAQNGGTHNIAGGFNYEMWTNSGNNASMEYTAEDGKFQFKANWNNPDDLLCRIGLYWGTGPRPNELDGDLHCDFNYDFTGTGGGYNYIGVYGWTKVPNEVEYYIVENTFFGSTAKQQGLYYGANKVSSYTIDGEGSYDLYIGTRTNAPSISGTSTFKQVFAVRSTPRKCGHISISEHMRNWTNHVTLGQLYDCKFLCEVGSGSGSFDLKYGNVWIGSSTQEPPTPSEPEEPYKGAIAIPGKLECENYDKGGSGFGYKDSDKKNEGEEYRQDGVDIVKVSDGYAIGYTASGEWLKYTINVQEAGDYNVGAYMANGSTDPEISLELDGKKATSIKGTGKGDWDTYTMAKGKISLSAGEHTLKLKFDNDYTNIDYLVFSKGEINDDPGNDDPGNDDPGNDDPGNDDPQPVAGGSTFFDEDGAYFGADCDNKNYAGAYYTGNYTSPFKTYLGKTDEEIQKKLDQMWQHYFVGSNKLYTDKGNGEAYILDTGNNDVRSEGMSYGMMISVQTNHKEEFDKLWKFAKNHMWHRNGDGYFSWQVGTDGNAKDQGCAPDGEMYFMMSLLFAANRWNDSGYMADAQAILKACWEGNTLFNGSSYIITFQPSQGNNTWSDPSYSLPAFVDLFSRWSTTNNDKWQRATSATRDHLYKSSNTKSGLFSDYNNFDGTPHGVSFNSNAEKYMYDAMRCAMNFGMDYYLFGADATRQEEMARRIIDFFERDGYQHARFNWDGSNPSEQYTLGETGANAVACYCLMNDSKYQDIVKKNLKMAWDANLMTGQWRYYDGLVHYLSMLHLCGSFKIWKPARKIDETIELKGKGSVEYNGKTYTESIVFDELEDCKKLNRVNILVQPTDVDDVNANGVVIAPNPASDAINVVAEGLESVTIVDMLGRTVAVSSEATVNVSNLPAGTYAVVVKTSAAEVVKKINVIK